MRAFKSHHAGAALVCLVVALAGAVPVQAGLTAPPSGENCVWEGEDTRTRSVGDGGGDEEAGAPRHLSPALYGRAATLVTSVDGLHGQELPISIVAVCDVPEELGTDAARLAGCDGVALRLRHTSVWDGRALKVGPAATAVIDGADTALVRGRLTRPSAWHRDEHGRRIATFRASRIKVTD